MIYVDSKGNATDVRLLSYVHLLNAFKKYHCGYLKDEIFRRHYFGLNDRDLRLCIDVDIPQYRTETPISDTITQ